jgi:cell division protein FtsQ
MWQDIRMLNATANALLGLMLLTLAGAGMWWLAQRPMFTLRMIRVESMDSTELRHVNALTVRGSAIPRIRGNFFTADLEATRLAFETVPWVRRATVRREWPNQLIVTLEEHEALGIWGDEGRLLSVKGDLFTANLAEAEDDHDLPEFAGPSGSEKEVLARYTEFQQWFGVLHLMPESVALSSRYAWTVKLNNGMSVELGREQDRNTLKERVDRLTGIYPQLMAMLQDKIDSVDMRYPNGLALKSSGLNALNESRQSNKKPAEKTKHKKVSGTI